MRPQIKWRVKLNVLTVPGLFLEVIVIVNVFDCVTTGGLMTANFGVVDVVA